MDELFKYEIDLNNLENENMIFSNIELKETISPLMGCELDLCYFNKYFNNGDSIEYYKDFKNKIKSFKKNIYNDLTAEDKRLILFLDKYKMTTINKAIQNNIKEMREIMKNKK